MYYVYLGLFNTCLVFASIFFSEIYTHRHLMHKSIKLINPFANFSGFFLICFNGLDIEKWCRGHYIHHKWSDTEKDLFSPRYINKWKLLFFIAYYYHKAIKKYDKESLGNNFKIPNFLNTLRDAFPFGTLGLIFLLLVFDIYGLFIWLTNAYCLTLYFGYVSSFVHGNTEYKNKIGTSLNIPKATFLTFGTSLHENHHKYPTRPNFAIKKGEIDPLWPIIIYLKKIKLVTWTR